LSALSLHDALPILRLLCLDAFARLLDAVHDRVADELNGNVLDGLAIGRRDILQAAAMQRDLLRLTVRNARRQILECAHETAARFLARLRLGFALRALLTSAPPIDPLDRK